MAQWPLIVVRDAEVARMEWLLNHERIHLAQQKETLVFGLMVLTLCEDFVSRVILKKSKVEAYYWRASEQEAYLNQHDLTYLKGRKVWRVFWYVCNKRRFKGTGVPGEIMFY